MFNQENLREKIVERLKKITLTIEGFVNIEDILKDKIDISEIGISSV